MSEMWDLSIFVGLGTPAHRFRRGYLREVTTSSFGDPAVKSGEPSGIAGGRPVQMVDGVPCAPDDEAAQVLDAVWGNWQELMDRLAK